jgi:hypothetical protein
MQVYNRYSQADLNAFEMQPTEIFQQYQGLLPFTTFSQTNNSEETLRQVAKQIEQIIAIISGIALNKESSKDF